MSKVGKGVSKVAKSKMGKEMMGSESSNVDENDPSNVMFNMMSYFGVEFLSMANGMNEESLLSMEAANEQE